MEAWAEPHREELTAGWNRLQQGRSPLPIEPLREQSDAIMHPIFRVVSASVMGASTLRITFDDALQRDIDFSPVLGGWR